MPDFLLIAFNAVGLQWNMIPVLNKLLDSYLDREMKKDGGGSPLPIPFINISYPIVYALRFLPNNISKQHTLVIST